MTGLIFVVLFLGFCLVSGSEECGGCVFPGVLLGVVTGAFR